MPVHPAYSRRECLNAEQAPRASQSPPHDFGLPVERWQTYARGFTRCKRHQKNPQVARHTQKTASGSAYASADANSPQCPAPRLHSARQKAAWLTSARGYVRCQRFISHGPAHPVNNHRECLVRWRTVTIPPLPATPNKKPLGVATRMPARTENLSSHHQPWPTKSRWPGLQTSRTAHERLVLRPCPIPGTPRKETRGVPSRSSYRTEKPRAQCPPHPEKSLREWLLGCHLLRKTAAC